MSIYGNRQLIWSKKGAAGIEAVAQKGGEWTWFAEAQEDAAKA
jgi:hypothetical protein